MLNYYKGTNINQDSRFINIDNKDINSMKYPKEYNITVYSQNIDKFKDIIKMWVNNKLKEILEFNDETLVNLIMNLIDENSEGNSDNKLNPKNIQLNVNGFLNDKTLVFMKPFWNALINLQNNFLKKEELLPELMLIQKKIEYNNKYKERQKKYYYKNENYYYKNEYKENSKSSSRNKYKNKNRSRSRSDNRNKSHSHSRKYRKGRVSNNHYYYKHRRNSKNDPFSDESSSISNESHYSSDTISNYENHKSRRGSSESSSFSRRSYGSKY